MLSKKKKISEQSQNSPIEFPGLEEKDEKPRRSYKWVWISGSGVLVLAVVGFVGYRMYQNQMFQHYSSAGNTALSVQNYQVAITDYNHALKYHADLKVQAQLQLAQSLNTSHESFIQGQKDYNNGNYQLAYNELKKVGPQDKADYNQAVAMENNAQTEVLVTKAITDLNTWMTDEGSWGTDVNAIITPSNSLSGDFVGNTSFSTDLTDVQTAFTQFEKDDAQLQNDTSAFNTDAQLIPSKQVQAIVSDAEKHLNDFGNDINGMDSTINNQISQAQQLESSNNYYGYLNTDYTTWNVDIADSGNQVTYLENDLAKLKAYQPARVTANGSGA